MADNFIAPSVIAFDHVFRGTRRVNSISGEWANVPRGPGNPLLNGTLELEVQEINLGPRFRELTIAVLNETGGFQAIALSPANLLQTRNVRLERFRDFVRRSSATSGRKAVAIAPSAVDLTGVWFADDGGVYWIRQIGSTVWWSGQSDEPGSTLGRLFSNVFHGQRSGNLILGSWADVPQGSILQSGTLEVRVSHPNLPPPVLMFKVNQTGNFGASIWHLPAPPRP